MSKTKIAVTPPQNDTPKIRAWMESTARRQGFVDLEWVPSNPPALMGRKEA